MTGVVNEKTAPKWSEWITDFDKSYDLFYDNYKGLKAQKSFIENQHPELKEKYNRLLKEAEQHKNKLEQLKNVRDKVMLVINEYQKLQPPEQPWPKAGGLLYGLGTLQAAPVVVGISIASASAALIAISKWIKDTYQFAQRVNELRRLENEEGLSPQEAANVVEKTMGPAETSLFGIPFKWIILGGVVIFVGPPLIKAISDGRKKA